MVANVFAIHVLLSEVTTLILEYLTVHGEYFRKEADLNLLVELVDGVAVDEDALPSGVGVQI